MRSYGTEPQVWGGTEGCQHEWGEKVVERTDTTGFSRHRKGLNKAAEITDGSVRQSTTTPPPVERTSNFCSLCGAWRGELGLEPSPESYVSHLVEVFREVRRVLRKDGTCWVNLGDSYVSGKGRYSSCPQTIAGHSRDEVGNGQRPDQKGHPYLKDKDLCGIPWRVAFALQADGWWLRSDIIWSKPNPMPESVTDRPTRSHEYIFLLTKSSKYFYDQEAVREPQEQSSINRAKYRLSGFQKYESANHSEVNYINPKTEQETRNKAISGTGRNLRSVWTFPTQPFSGWTQTSRWVLAEQGEPFYGKMRIVSQDCGYQDRSRPTFDGGVRVGDATHHTLHNANHHVQELLDDYESTDQNNALMTGKQNLSSPPPPRSFSATDHNNETHRTGHDPATNSPCTFSEETLYRIDDRSTLRANSGWAAHRLGSNKAVDSFLDAKGIDPSAEILYHSSDNSLITPDCTCTIYKKITEKSSHFATFPEELVQRCIMAGTAAQACPKCGAAWIRIVEKTGGIRGDWNPRKRDGACKLGDNKLELTYQRNDLGFRPSCDCPDNDGSGRCVVCDPFMGSGTVGKVAESLGRDWIGIDLKPEYNKMAQKRTKVTIGMGI